MKISIKQTIVAGITSFLCVILFVSALARDINAKEKTPKSETMQSVDKSDSGVKDVNDPNEWSKWDAAIKDPNDPNEMLEAKWNAIATVLQNKDLNQEPKKKIIDKIVSPIFDFDLMAKLVLGRTNWPKLTVSEQKRFTELFAERLKSFYLEKTSLYNNEKVVFKPETKNKSSIYIPMVMNRNDKEIEILYKLRKIDEADKAGMKEYWKIYDVEIEGVSVLLTYQSQFDDILHRGSVKDLFDLLEKPSTE